MPGIVREAEAALSKGDISHIDIQLDDLLETFQINLDKKSAAYRELGLEALRAEVRGLRAIEQRSAGEPIQTPPLAVPSSAPAVAHGQSTLSSAFDRWKSARNRAPRLFRNTSTRSSCLDSGDMPLAAIRKRQARQFREALQDVPVKQFRTGKLRTATLPELAAWGREHANAQKIGASTINKLLGALQSVCRWARREELVPDNWTDRFADMRVDGNESERAPFETKELRASLVHLCSLKVITLKAGRVRQRSGYPLALFTGSRLEDSRALKHRT